MMTGAPCAGRDRACKTLAIIALAVFSWSMAFGQNTSFTYQGRLTANGNAHTGDAEFQATLWDAETQGTLVATNRSGALLADVANGLFTLPLDFGADFSAAERWLQLEVRTSLGPFSTLTPRQRLTPTPYALSAAHLTGTLGAGQLSGVLPSANLAGNYSAVLALTNAGNSFRGNGTGLTALNASQLSTGTVSDARLSANVARTNQVWLVGGNRGTLPGTQFLGTTDAQPLDIRVNNARALRIEPNTNGAPNWIAGAPVNYVDPEVIGATIAGGGSVSPDFFGGSNQVFGTFGTIGGGSANSVFSPYSTISGGAYHSIGTNAHSCTIGGGFAQAISDNTYDGTLGGGSYCSIGGYSDYATISGGRVNSVGANATSASIGGGMNNVVSGAYGTLGGGSLNSVSNICGTIGGGSNNRVTGSFGTVPGGENNSAGAWALAAGYRAKANHSGAFVWADKQESDFASTVNNQFSVRAAGGVRLAADVQIGTGSGDYRRLQLGGGNSDGFLYGSFPRFADGVHLSYNYYANAAGQNKVIHPDGATSRLTVGYGFVSLSVGGVGSAPTLERLAANGNGVTVFGTFNNSSDRAAKQDFEPIDPATILGKVIGLPLCEWSYKEDPTTRHIGPMAQDFHAAFRVGTDERHIAPLDEGGVALAAIQGLDQKLEDRTLTAERRIKQLETENAALQARVESMEETLKRLMTSSPNLDGNR